MQTHIHTDISWTEAAWERFKAVEVEFGRMAAYYGDQLAEQHQAEFLRTLSRVTFSAGQVEIHADGTGFLIFTPYITIGLVWTPDSDAKMTKRVEQATGITVVAFDDDWPRTGTWSAHS